jgi:hypothetical protein
MESQKQLEELQRKEKEENPDYDEKWRRYLKF